MSPDAHPSVIFLESQVESVFCDFRMFRNTLLRPLVLLHAKSYEIEFMILLKKRVSKCFVFFQQLLDF